jgi:hypothetical protein
MMSEPLPWISASDADDMLYDDPMDSLPDFGFALLRKAAKGKQNRVADLARAKLQPSKPANKDWLADGLWPITCAAHRIFTAPGVAVEPGMLESIFHDYDAKAKAHQKLLAIVLTMRFPHSWQRSASASTSSRTGSSTRSPHLRIVDDETWEAVQARRRSYHGVKLHRTVRVGCCRVSASAGCAAKAGS